jgi:hypothetical protein
VTTFAGRVYDRLPPRLRRRVPVEVRADVRERLGAWVPGDLGFVPTPPRVAPGERTGPPDFLVVGPAESGARWWLSLLADHPDVAPTRDPDAGAHAFDRYCTDGFGPAEVAAFHALFPRRPGRVIGHWAPDALSYPWIAPLLAQAAPRARVLVLVRDPVDLLADRVAATASTRPPHEGANLADAVDRGFQGAQLARLGRLFPPESVRVLQFERCLADPAGSLASTFAFLEVAPPDGPGLPHPSAGTTTSPGGALDPGTRARLRELYEEDVALLARQVPDLELDRWPWSGPVPEH